MTDRIGKRVRSLTAVLLLLSMLPCASPAWGATKSARAILTPLNEGRKISVELIEGSRRLSGRRGKLSGDSFTLEPLNKGTAGTQDVRFDQIESVRASMSPGKRLAVVAGSCLLVLVLVGLIAGSRV